MIRKNWLARMMASKKFTITMIGINFLFLISNAFYLILYAMQDKWGIAGKEFLCFLVWIVWIVLNFQSLKAKQANNQNT